MRENDRLGGLIRAMALLLMVLASGCVTTQESVTMQQNMLGLQQQNQALEERLKALERQVRGDAGGAGSGPRSLADLASTIEGLQVELGSVKGRLEEQGRQIEQLKNQMAASEPAAQAPGPNIQVAAPGAAAPAAAPAAPSSAPAAASPAAPAPAPAAAPVPSPSQDPEKAQYTKALKLHQEKNFDAARKEFIAFVQQFPKSILADNAQFWIGEAHFEQQHYKEAIAAYQQVVDHYPNGNKVPTAILQQANAWSKLGDKTAARILYQRVVDRYPNALEAGSAAEKLKQLQ